jgi:hypothetical protein
LPEQTYYQFVMELFDGTGAALGREPFEPDMLPARECARFEAIRLQMLPDMTAVAVVRFEPVWSERSGRPYVEGLRAGIGGHDGRTLNLDFPKTYFNHDAQRVSDRYVIDGRLRSADVFYYKVAAFAASGPKSDTAATDAEEISQPLEIRDTPIEQLRSDSVVVDSSVEGDAPVFLRHEALSQAKGICAAAGNVEVGGILLGRLHRDTVDRHLLFIEITGQVPAEHTVQRFTRLTFTADTWAAARTALRLRGCREQMLGWFHLHPDFCKVRQCDAAKREKCELAGIFFSTDDCALHRTVFPMPQHLALLISDRGGSLVPAVFGWRRGAIVQRGFQITRPPSATQHEARISGGGLAVAVGGNEHAEH